MEEKDIAERMRRSFSAGVFRLLRRIGALSEECGYRAYLVGGPVRDLLLGRSNVDLDIAIEGDAIHFAKVLTVELKGTAVPHKRFGTCTVITKDKLRIDFATARQEVYKRPGDLPWVSPSSLKNDLFRRDFTINAMAAGLNRDDFGKIIDPFGGRADLASGRIRVLHDGSFIDDPTRIFRAVRFEQRFGFVIDGYTEELITHAVEERMFDKVSPHRVGEEVILLLKEREPLKAVIRMAKLHELRFIHPKIKFSARMKRAYSSVERALRWYLKLPRPRTAFVDAWLVYFMALIDGLTYDEASAICHRFALTRQDRDKLLSFKAGGKPALERLSKKKAAAPSAVYRVLEGLAPEAVLMAMAIAPSARARSHIKAYLGRYSGVKVSITGLDLKALGLKPSPRFKRLLDAVLYSKIDGYLKTKADELAYARRMAKKR